MGQGSRFPEGSGKAEAVKVKVKVLWLQRLVD
jgi:hypothetical protein